MTKDKDIVYGFYIMHNEFFDIPMKIKKMARMQKEVQDIVQMVS